MFSAPAQAVAAPPVFSPTVPTTMDSGVVAMSLSEPATLPSLPEQKTFKMADGRYYNPATGTSGATQEEALGIASTTRGPVQATGPTGVPAASAQVDDSVTTSIRALFPESDSMVKQYQDLRKSSGVEQLESELAKVNQEAEDMNAVIQGIEDEVRNQAGGMADASFIEATIADRMRRLMPRINQITARQSALTSNIAAKKDIITEQLGFSQADLTRSTQDRENVRKGIFDMLDIYGSNAFSGTPPEIIAELERRAGLPLGAIAAKTKTLAEAPESQSITERYGTGSIGEYNYYSEQERASGRSPLSFDAWLTQDANRKRAVNIAGGMTPQQSSQFLNVTNKFQADPLILKAIDAGIVSGIMDSVIADPRNPTNQLNVLYGYVKALDPDSAVREGELALAQTAQSYLARFGNSIVRLAEGRTIDPKVAAEMAKATKGLASARQEAAKKRESFYRSQASGLGIGDSFGQYLGGIELPYASGGGGGDAIVSESGEFSW